ncbi:polysaccharide deacetylase family sporulation protein PdaB [Microaerobacter geothermalis]|uniref:polysaccharide deacetylase family sporulation protein PdaB n=1 Tax=Microaerobacter geothermalis TaxID=674972 RepID=UPI001F3FD6E8|nr:polysaccharide deacetylase family sporulation protein PdaB [Microaerobacter geothermalis]
MLAFLLILLLGFTLLFPTSAAYAEEPWAAIYNVKTDEKVVALTFDISWGNNIPHPVLDVLEYTLVNKATFFLSGPWALKHQDIVKRIDAMGFEIGSHGYQHQNYSARSNDWIREQVKLAEKALYDITGKKPTLIRTPNGDFNPRVLKVLHDMGYKVIQWDTDSLDWKKPGVQRVVNRVLSRVHPGDIILMHASDSCPDTPEALPMIIAELRKRGYRFATVSELMEMGK